MLTTDDLEPMAIGSAILGSGGGGDPVNDVMMARYALEQHGSVHLKKVDALTDDDFIVPLGMMGAPLVGMEKLATSRELEAIVTLIEKTLGRRPTALIATEIGGANAFCPLLIAGRLGLPVIDGDLIGRAFPQLQMCSANLCGVSCSPAFMSDSLNTTVMLCARDALTTEHLARHVTVGMGSCCALSIYTMNGQQAKTSVVSGTVTQAIALGRTVLEARLSARDPVASVTEAHQGKLLTQGTISDVDQRVQGGFLEGSVTIGDVVLLYQNEYLLARRDNSVIGATPDILMLLETESGTPITSESLRYGVRASLIALPAPHIWRSSAGLALVGPAAFGFNNIGRSQP